MTAADKPHLCNRSAMFAFHDSLCEGGQGESARVCANFRWLFVQNRQHSIFDLKCESLHAVFAKIECFDEIDRLLGQVEPVVSDLECVA